MPQRVTNGTRYFEHLRKKNMLNLLGNFKQVTIGQD